MIKKFILFLLFISVCGTSSADGLFASGSFALRTSTGNQSITGLGFQPKLVIIYGNPKADPQGTASSLKTTFGAATDATHRFVVMTTNSWGGSVGTGSPSATYFLTNRMFAEASKFVSGSTLTEADLVTMDADGFTINVTKTAGTAFKLFYIAFGGSDVSAYVGTWTSAVGTGAQSITGVGFSPNAMMVLRNASFNIGMADGQGNQFTKCSYDNGNGVNLSVTGVYQSMGAFISSCSNGAVTTKATLTNFTNDGAVVNYSVNGGSTTYGIVALRGLQTYLGTINQKTSTGLASYNGFGFQPSAAFLVSSGQATSSAVNTQYRVDMGAGTASNNVRTSSGADNNANSVSGGNSYTSEASIISHITANGSTPTIKAAASLTSFDADGLTLNWGTADSTARESAVLAFAPLATASHAIKPKGVVLNGLQINP